MENRIRRPLALGVALVALAGTASGMAPLVGRADAEHVVLADCRDGDGVFSSQMAYFPGPPGKKPQDVSVVATPAGQTALWVGQTTSSLFSTSGVTFTARLGPKVDEGAFAGTGDNGFGNFSCWQRFSLNLYEYGGNMCAQVYDCDHEPPPAKTTSSAPTSGPTVPASGRNSTANANAGASQAGGLSTGALAAVIIGVVAVVVITLAVAGFVWFRRRSRNRPPGAEPAGCLAGLCGRRGRPVEMGESGGSKASSSWSAVAAKKEGGEQARTQFYELDGQWYGAEVHGNESRVEMDASQRAAELDARRRSGMTFAHGR